MTGKFLVTNISFHLLRLLRLSIRRFMFFQVLVNHLCIMYLGSSDNLAIAAVCPAEKSGIFPALRAVNHGWH